MDDSDLVDIGASKLGDAKAFARLVDRHQSAVIRQLWRFTRDRRVCEELTQDVFIEVYFSLPSYAQKSPFGHWIARITTRVGYRYWKRAERENRTQAIEHHDVAARSSDEPEAAAEVVHKLLARLKPPERMVLTLMYLNGLSVAEVADRTGWNRAVVKMRSMRARRRMREIAEVTLGDGGTK